MHVLVLVVLACVRVCAVGKCDATYTRVSIFSYVSNTYVNTFDGSSVRTLYIAKFLIQSCIYMGPLQLQGLNAIFCMFVVLNVMRQTYISVLLTLAVYFGF